MPEHYLHVNIENIIRSAGYIGGIPERLSLRAAYEMRNIARELLIQTFQEAFAVADSEDGFPPEFQNHVIRTVQDMRIDTFGSGGTVEVIVDFEDLGDENDLVRAFHQGARLADGSKLWGPYEGQELAQEDASIRHIFWENIRRDNNSAVVLDGKTVKLSDPHSWGEMIEQYVSIWGEKSPEWLFVQYGQEEWEPYIPPYDIIEEFSRALYAVNLDYLYQELVDEVSIANAYASIGVDVGFTIKGQPRLLHGNLVNPKTGKTINPGQFAPKL